MWFSRQNSARFGIFDIEFITHQPSSYMLSAVYPLPPNAPLNPEFFFHFGDGLVYGGAELVHLVGVDD